MHFVRHGWKEERNPSQEFEIGYYLKKYPDVKNSGMNPLVHYIRYGKNERRWRKASDENFILDNSKFLIHEDPFKNSSYNFGDEIQQYDDKVSIVIPTKNAGDDFDYLLKMLKNQEGIREIEIVIVDSGSEDNTLQTAKVYDTKVISILPEEFTHSYARNLGAEHASGDYLLFTVQDALPPTETWLYELLTILKKNDVCAVSCAETPREDADLFYRVISWNHYNFLDVNRNDRIFKLPDNPNYISLRQNGQLSDIACLIPSETFMKYKYRLNYAEDLDLGIRLVKDGNQIAFLGSTRIIHSHNRPAFYFLKRGYVDNLYLSDTFSDYPIPTLVFDDVISDIIFTCNFIIEEINYKISTLRYPINNDVIAFLIKDAFQSACNFTYPGVIDINNAYFDNNYKKLFKGVISSSGYAKSGEQYNGFLISSLQEFVKMMFAYLKMTNEEIDENLSYEIRNCIFKGFSSLTGAHLAYCYIHGSKTKNKDLEMIHTMLTEGV